MKTRKHDFYDPANHRALYGVQVFIEGQWMNCMLNGKPILCETEQERDAARKQVQINARNAIKKAKAQR